MDVGEKKFSSRSFDGFGTYRIFFDPPGGPCPDWISTLASYIILLSLIVFGRNNQFPSSFLLVLVCSPVKNGLIPVRRGICGEETGVILGVEHGVTSGVVSADENLSTSRIGPPLLSVLVIDGTPPVLGWNWGR